MAGTNMCLPTCMFAPIQPAPVRLERFKQIMTQLSVPAQLKKLATDVRFLKQQTGLINSAVGHLQQACNEQACRQLLAKAPEMLRQLVLITTAVLQQLARQRDSDLQVSQAAAMLVDSLAWLLQSLSTRRADPHSPAAPVNAANLRMMHDTGLLKAYAAAAQAVVSFLSNNPQLPRASQTAAALHVQLMGKSAHMLASAGNAMLLLWNSLMLLMPTTQLLSAQSLLLDSALPTATLAMALARAYASDEVFCGTVMWQVLGASCTLAAAAASGKADAYYSVLARQELFELLLLGLAASTGLLHEELKGTSTQTLPPSMRPTDTLSSSSSSSSGSRDSSSGSRRLAVSAHHKGLLQALTGVRQLPALHDHLVATLSNHMWVLPLAINAVIRTRVQDAQGLGPAATISSCTSASAKEAVTAGEVVPWQLALPLVLTQLELYALAPPRLTEQLSVLCQQVGMLSTHCNQLQFFTHPHHWQPGQQPPNWPSYDKVQLQLQQCVQSVWLQLGPALLCLCRQRSGEAAGEGEERQRCTLVSMTGEPVGATSSRQVFATFSELLTKTVNWQVLDSHRTPTIDLAAVMKQNPLLACSVLEAALHASADYSGPPGAAVNEAAAVAYRLTHASATCCAAAVAIPVLADATCDTIVVRSAAAAQHEASPAAAGATTPTDAEGGQQTAAAAAHAHGNSKLEQKLACVLVAALKFTQASATLQGSAEATLRSNYNVRSLLCACSSAVFRILGSRSHLTLCDDSMSASAVAVPTTHVVQDCSERRHQLIWLDVLGRLLVAAGQLLQQIQHVLIDPTGKQVAQYAELMRALNLSVTAYGMFGMLGQGKPVSAGLPAAATKADLVRLLQQATALQQHVMDIEAPFKQISQFDTQGMEAQQLLVSAQAMLKLLAAYQQGGLPQQLHSFGVAYCAAFPQRGRCGNPACINLDKFTETALAGQGCSGGNKAVKFCSPACHKTAWKQGHKAACAILKQRHATAGAAATGTGV